MLPKRGMYLKALLGVSTDLPKLWDKISSYQRTNLGGEDGKYTVYFTGDINDGIAVLETLLAQANGEIQITIGY